MEFSFEADTMTHDGGLLLIQRFGHQLGFRRRLQRLWRDVPNWSKHDPLDMVRRDRVHAHSGVHFTFQSFK